MSQDLIQYESKGNTAVLVGVDGEGKCVCVSERREEEKKEGRE